jgi:glycosyltransferase involved in cell wall biosynthesis
MKHVFKVVITSYNCARWLPWALDSIASQKYPRQVCVVDDASTDPEQWTIISRYCEKYGWRSVRNEKNRGALYSRVVGIDALECGDDDIIVNVDGDDWLSRDDALDIVARAYDKGDILLTYGSYMTYPDGERGVCRPTPRGVVQKNAYRQHRWVFSHLKTFRYILWKNISREDFARDGGEYYREATDMAFMYPMLEMSGGRFQFIKDVLYVYNRASENSIDRLRRGVQVGTETKIRSRKPYSPLDLTS